MRGCVCGLSEVYKTCKDRDRKYSMKWFMGILNRKPNYIRFIFIYISHFFIPPKTPGLPNFCKTTGINTTVYAVLAEEQWIQNDSSLTLEINESAATGFWTPQAESYVEYYTDR